MQVPKRTILCLVLVITLSEPAALTQLALLLLLNPSVAGRGIGWLLVHQGMFVSGCCSVGQGCLLP